MKILIDNGHGENTSGKCSPDKTLREYAYTREIAKRLVTQLKANGYDAELLTPETTDITLGERVRRANAKAKAAGGKAIVVSIHVNAAGSDGKWHQAGGWCAYTSKGKTKADTLAEHLYDAAKVHLKGYAATLEAGKKDGRYTDKQRPFRTDTSDGDSDIEEDFYILKNTSSPAVLTENLFQDNKQDVEFLLSEEGKKAIVQLHMDGITNYIKATR